MSNLDIEWFDTGKEPQCAPNPQFPDGMDIDLRMHKDEPSCEIELPYPAKRCGMFLINCNSCRRNAVITTAGRPDDPRRVILPCKKKKQ
jgi:hypothetical protein